MKQPNALPKLSDLFEPLDDAAIERLHVALQRLAKIIEGEPTLAIDIDRLCAQAMAYNDLTAELSRERPHHRRCRDCTHPLEQCVCREPNPE